MSVKNPITARNAAGAQKINGRDKRADTSTKAARIPSLLPFYRKRLKAKIGKTDFEM